MTIKYRKPINNPYKVVKLFEEEVADYTGSPYAVSIDSCTNAIFLVCKYLNVADVIIPSKTYLSVPQSIIHSGGNVIFDKTEETNNWKGIYQLKPYPIYDAAKRFTSNMYIPNSFMCLSFHIKKHLKIGKGGIILTDNEDSVKWFKKARYEGRSEKLYHEDDIDMLGWNMYMTPQQAAHGLALMQNYPLDVPDLDSAIALINRLPQVTFWKVGLELFTSTGPKILDILKSQEKRIFLDLKFHDIPNTVAGACRAAAGYGVDLLTIHATCGSDALKAAGEAVEIGAEKAGKKPPQLIAITLLTSISPRQLAFDLKIPLELPEFALEMALLAEKSGLNGAVCSPQEVQQLRETCKNDFLLVCPGVRPTWSDKGDQKRSLTPSQAITAGADYLV
ncbi:orotidine-5'-phosphate decarboxylase, partial [bacterium]|nr:orotidine-5'-phosphate decarboxylase [bacterium]